ncbi:MAG: hypothetical protein JWO12_3202 [Frankiales bacterium]|nr:hypothetical protein [Frankiales bacterium]
MPRKQLLKVLAAVAALGALGYAVYSQRTAISHDLTKLDAGTVLGAAAALLGGLGCSVMAWRALLVGLGSDLPVPTAARIFFVGQLGKYIPGSVWPVLAQMQMGKAVGVPRLRMAAASLMAVILSLATGLLVGVLAAGSLPAGFAPTWLLAVVALVPLLLVLAKPQLITQGLQLVLKTLRRKPLDGEFAGGAVRLAVLWTVGVALFNGLQAWLLARGLGGHDEHLFLLATGAFSLAQTGGVLVLFVPAGAGVREGLLVAILGGALTTSEGTTLSVVSRLLVTLTDGLAAGVALLGARALERVGDDPVPAGGDNGSAPLDPEGP